jgi:hypothetical protein
MALQENGHILIEALGKMSRLTERPPLQASRRSIETRRVLSDQNLMRSILKSYRAEREGNVHSLDEARKKVLG